jgi:hypothetical protein
MKGMVKVEDDGVKFEISLVMICPIPAFSDFSSFYALSLSE